MALELLLRKSVSTAGLPENKTKQNLLCFLLVLSLLKMFLFNLGSVWVLFWSGASREGGSSLFPLLYCALSLSYLLNHTLSPVI